MSVPEDSYGRDKDGPSMDSTLWKGAYRRSVNNGPSSPCCLQALWRIRNELYLSTSSKGTQTSADQALVDMIRMVTHSTTIEPTSVKKHADFSAKGILSSHHLTNLHLRCNLHLSPSFFSFKTFISSAIGFGLKARWRPWDRRRL